jgi:molecular chaperone DnaJ
MAKKYHPDINKAPDAKEKFAELNGAYQILVDDKKREMYDMTGSAEAAEGGHGGYGGPFGGGMSREQAEEIFNQFFGGGGPFGGSFSSAFGRDPFASARETSDAPRHGSDVRQVLTVTLKEAVYGAKKDIRVQKATPCTTCSGSGENPKKKSTTCTACNGRGEVEQRQAFFVVRTTCGKCGGSGKITHNCTTCGGSGYQKEMKTLEVSVNAGVDNGSILRVKGYGEPGFRGGQPGDVYLEIVVEKDHVFRRKGQDLEMDVTIPMHQAVLGGSTNVKHLNGEMITVTVPAGSQYNDRIVIAGKGVPHRTSSKSGNLNVYIKIQIPKSLTPEQRKAMEEYATQAK